MDTPVPVPEETDLPPVDRDQIRKIIDNAPDGYLKPGEVSALLDAAGVSRAKERVISHEDELGQAAAETGFPLVMKVAGPVHKSDVGGVKLNITDSETLLKFFREMMRTRTPPE
jgi:acetyltransferase